MIDGLEIVLHVFRQAVEHVRVPALGRDVEPTFAARVQQLLVKPLRVVQQDFIPAREKKRRRQVSEVAEQRRAERIFGVLRVAGRIKVQKLFRERRVVVAVLVECRARLRQIRPRRNGDDRYILGKSPKTKSPCAMLGQAIL